MRFGLLNCANERLLKALDIIIDGEMLNCEVKSDPNIVARKKDATTSRTIEPRIYELKT